MLKNKKIWMTLFLLSISHGNLSAMGDPTKPPMAIQLKQVIENESKKVEVVKLQLNAIKIVGSTRLAIIDGHQYAIGQVIGKSRVKSISLNKVVLVSGKTLSLFDKTHFHVANKGN